MSINTSLNRRVLVVEDEPRLRAMLIRAIPDMGFEPLAAASGEEALDILGERPTAVAILDLNLPGIGGMALFEKLREHWPDTQVIIMTGYGDLDTAQQAIRLNVADFLTKPCSLGDLEHALDRAWRRRLDADGQTNMPPEPNANVTRELTAHTDQPQTIQNVEKQLIFAALERNQGNRTATAQELGISVRTLYYRLSLYGISPE